MDRVETLTFFFPLSILSYSTFFVCALFLFYISPSLYFFIISFFFLRILFLSFSSSFFFYLCREGSSRIRAKKQRQEEKGEEFVKREECNVWSYVILSAVRWPTMLSLFFSVRASWPPRILPKRFWSRSRANYENPYGEFSEMPIRWLDRRQWKEIKFFAPTSNEASAFILESDVCFPILGNFVESHRVFQYTRHRVVSETVVRSCNWYALLPLG